MSKSKTVRAKSFPAVNSPLVHGAVQTANPVMILTIRAGYCEHAKQDFKLK